jgi:hypothetical protein
MSVKPSSQSLLIEVVCNQTDRSSKNEKSVQDTILQVILSLFSTESTTVSDQVDEANSNTSINVQDQVVLLGSGNSLDGQCVVKELMRGEVLQDVFLDKLYTQVGVVAGFDLVSDSGDELVLLPHRVDEITGRQPLVESTGELSGGSVQSSSESLSDGQKSRDQRGDQVLSSTGGNDGVHSSGNSGTVISSQHKDHLQELARVRGKTTTEPKQRHDTSDSNVLFEDVRNRHSSVEKLLSTVVGDGGDEGGGFTDETEFLGPGVVDGDLRRGRLRLGDDSSLGDEVIVDSLESLGEVLEGLGNVETGFLHGGVLGCGGLKLGVGEGSSVSELDFGGQHGCDGSDGPGDNGLGDHSLLDGLNDTVLLDSSNLSEQDQDLALGVGLVTQQVVNEGGTGVTISSDSNSLVDTVGGGSNDVVQLVGHTSRLGDVSDGTGTVKLGGNDVVHHTSSVSNLETSGLDTSDGSRSDDGDTLLLGNVQDLTCATLRNTLSDDGNRPDLGLVHKLESRAVDGTGRGKVYDLLMLARVLDAHYGATHGVNVGVLFARLVNLLVDGEKGLRRSPVHLGDELSSEGVDDSCYGRSLALADEVEIQHSLACLGLQSVDEGSRLGVEQSVLRGRRARP